MFVNCVSAVGKHVRCTPWGWDEAGNSPGLCVCTLPFLNAKRSRNCEKPLSNPSSFVLIMLDTTELSYRIF